LRAPENTQEIIKALRVKLPVYGNPIYGASALRRDFHLSVKIEQARQLIIFSIIGTCNSPALTEQIFAAYDKLDNPWLYDRVYDFRRCDGFLGMAEVERLAGWCAEKRAAGLCHSKVSIVVPGAIDLPRVAAIAHLFPTDILKGFTSVDDALMWLDAEKSRAA
jgi:hypothetical protein